MNTLVTEIHPTNVREVGEVEPEFVDEDEVLGAPAIFLEGDLHGLTVKGLQVSGYVLWFMPSEFPSLANFFGGEQ